MTASEYAKQSIGKYLKNTIIASRNELEAQGHRASGRTSQSFRAEVLQVGGFAWTGTIYVKQSAIILNKGVLARNVPYAQGSGATKSAYISALLEWAAIVQPNLSDKERKGFVFAVARKAKREGHPTRNSFRFSNNGRRRDWIKFSVDLNESNIAKVIDLKILGNLILKEEIIKFKIRATT